MNITIAELRKVPYLDLDHLHGRKVNLMPLWDGKRWCQWLPTASGLFEMHPLDTFKSDYVAKEPAVDSDLIIPFVELMWQRACWPETATFISAILADFHNLGTSIEKLDHFYLNQKEIGLAVADFVATELEYLFVLSQSIFDLLHTVIKTIWGGQRLELLNPAAEKTRKGHQLPDSFHSMLYQSNKPRERHEMIEKYAFPPSLAEAYILTRHFFDDIRAFRNRIVHEVGDTGLLFSDDRGFCLPKNFRSTLGLSCPAPDAVLPGNDNLVSLAPLLAYVVVNTIDCCSHLASQFARQIQLPPEMAPGYRIFVRGPHGDALLWALSVAKGGSPWWSDRQRKPKTRPPSPQPSG